MFLKIDKLSDCDFNLISKELDPLFNNESIFQQSSIVSEQNIQLGVRNSSSAFPTLDQVMDTSIILQLISKEIFREHIIFDEMIPDVQLLKYGPGQFYNWHSDTIKEDNIDSIRIVTVSLNLNEEYTGGSLEIKHKKDIVKLPPKAGYYAIFPSFLPHRAVTVDTGCRKAITLWIKGNGLKLDELHKKYQKSD